LAFTSSGFAVSPANPAGAHIKNAVTVNTIVKRHIIISFLANYDR